MQASDWETAGGASRELGIPARRLLQQATKNVTVVVTAAELREAVATGAPHIEIHAHLDLTTLDGGSDLNPVPPSVTTIRVRVPLPPRDPPIHTHNESLLFEMYAC